MSALTCSTDSFQQQVQQLFIHVLTDVDLWGEEDRACVGHGQVLAANSVRQQFLWHFGDLWQTTTHIYLVTVKMRDGNTSLFHSCSPGSLSAFQGFGSTYSVVMLHNDKYFQWIRGLGYNNSCWDPVQ